MCLSYESVYQPLEKLAETRVITIRSKPRLWTVALAAGAVAIGLVIVIPKKGR